MVEETKEKEATSAPSTDIEIVSYYNEALKLQEYAESRIINTFDDIKLANDDLSVISHLKKAMESRRKAELRPHREKAEAIQDNYNRWMAPVLAADRITRDKMIAFSNDQSRIRREQEEINRKRQEAAEAEMRLKGELSEPVNLVEVSEAPKRVSTDMGSTSTIKVRKWRLVDISKVPPEFLLVDAGKVTKLVKAGIGSIAGIEIYEEESIRVTTR